MDILYFSSGRLSMEAAWESDKYIAGEGIGISSGAGKGLDH